ncbi:MAG: transferrin-binding protein-like solute binding protein [Alphaproteobacteria bacterium]|nr:transferrin-binding protein-like solute binding protein [Alphaproteobacteria bacterium]
MKNNVYFIVLSMLLTACAADITVHDTDESSTDTEIGDITTTEAPAVDNADFNSFVAIATSTDEADSDDNETLTLSGTAVQDNINLYYSRPNKVATLDRVDNDFTVSRINNPVISLGFNKNGRIASTTLYVDDKTYVADDPTTSTSISFYQELSDPDDGSIGISVSRNFENRHLSSSRIWNFISQYMVHIHWDIGDDSQKVGVLTDSDIYYDGYMVAGFKTADDDLLNKIGKALFYGSGRGYYTENIYSSNISSQGISFSVLANIDFDDKKVGLETTGTYHCFGTCTNMSRLNFTANFNYTDNNLTSVIEADGMLGRLDARFYGTGDNAAQELGGTFAMRSGDARYIGSFGLTRTDTPTIATNDDAPSVDTLNYASLQLSSEGADSDDEDKTLHLSGLSVLETVEQFRYRPGNARLPNWNNTTHLISEYLALTTISNPIISLTFDENGYISGISLYVKDKTYTAALDDDSTGSAISFDEAFDAPIDENITSNITIEREFDNGDNDNDFTAQYMMNINWNIDDNNFPGLDNTTAELNDDEDGYDIEGIETTGSDIPNDGDVTFSGTGEGKYKNTADDQTIDYDIRFNVTAEVDFSGRTIELETKDTIYCSTTDDDKDCDDDDDDYEAIEHLNFTSKLTYDKNTNELSDDNATTAGPEDEDDDAPEDDDEDTPENEDEDAPESNIEKLTGTVNAKFYGANDYPIEQLAGTFMMAKGDDKNYFGHFGLFPNDRTTSLNDEINGYMIAGIETSGSDIPIDGKAEFIGNGAGRYHLSTTDYNLEFDVIANIDFSERTLELETTDTTRVSCTRSCNFSHLNFTSTLSYDSGKNNISGNVVVDDMNGTVDARFYGTGDNVAEELGGTFITRNGINEYYYGYFGATQAQTILDVTTSDAPSVDELTYTSLQAISEGAVDDNESKAFIRESLAVQATNDKFYSRDDAETDWDDDGDDLTHQNVTLSIFNAPVISISFNDAGHIASTNLYVGDNTYEASLTATGSATSFSEEFTGLGDDVSSNITIDRDFNNGDDSFFNFTANYMMNINWDIDDDSKPDTVLTNTDNFYDGYMITGIETAGRSIPRSNAVIFKGNGAGYYQTASTDYNTQFNVTANVNFVTRTIGLQTTNTTNLSTLDFTAILNYNSRTNNISGNVEANGMTGTANARFYGTGDDVAKELGGTFAMRNGNNRYIGYFGATQYPDIANITTTDDAPDIDTLAYKSLQAASDAAVTDEESKELHLSGLAVQETNDKSYTRPDDETEWDKDAHFTDDNFTASTINKSVISITFDDSGHIASANLYVGAEDYEADLTATGSATSFSEEFTELGDDVSGNITIDTAFNNSDDASFDFTAKYMMNIKWNIDDTSKSKTALTDTDSFDNGYMIAGIATDNDSIPLTGAFTFKGNGIGYYQTKTNSYDTKFNVIANVNFAKRTVGLQTIDTNNNLSELNFTSLLHYREADNNISGNVEANGMKGTIDARFYGADDDAAKELGGKFIMQKDADEYYLGFFGATR